MIKGRKELHAEARALFNGTAARLVLIPGSVGAGKSFTCEAVVRWARLRSSFRNSPTFLCKLCKGSGLEPKTFKECACRAQEAAWVRIYGVFMPVYRFGSGRRNLAAIIAADSGFDKPDWVKEAINEILNSPFLVIDDLGSERGNIPTFEAGLCSIIEQRRRDGLVTWITTQLSGMPQKAAPGQSIFERYGERGYSRIVSGAKVIKFAGPDRRKHVKGL